MAEYQGTAGDAASPDRADLQRQEDPCWSPDMLMISSDTVEEQWPMGWGPQEGAADPTGTCWSPDISMMPAVTLEEEQWPDGWVSQEDAMEPWWPAPPPATLEEQWLFGLGQQGDAADAGCPAPPSATAPARPDAWELQELAASPGLSAAGMVPVAAPPPSMLQLAAPVSTTIPAAPRWWPAAAAAEPGSRLYYRYMSAPTAAAPSRPWWMVQPPPAAAAATSESKVSQVVGLMSANVSMDPTIAGMLASSSRELRHMQWQSWKGPIQAGVEGSSGSVTRFRWLLKHRAVLEDVTLWAASPQDMKVTAACSMQQLLHAAQQDQEPAPKITWETFFASNVVLRSLSLTNLSCPEFYSKLVSLTHLEITEPPSQDFPKLPSQLRSLVLNMPQLRELPPQLQLSDEDVPQLPSQLKSLVLKMPQLRELPPQLLLPAGITRLDLSGCYRLASVPEQLPAGLEDLQLQRCLALKKLNLAACSKLVSLGLSWSRHLHIDGIDGNSTVQRLVLNHCAHDSNIIRCFSNLSSLQLECTQLEELDLAKCSTLRTLNVSGSLLKLKLPRGITSLEALDCVKLVSFDPRLKELTSLKKLTVEKSRLSSKLLPPNLEVLNLRDCKGAEYSVSKLTQLQHLELRTEAKEDKAGMLSHLAQLCSLNMYLGSVGINAAIGSQCTGLTSLHVTGGWSGSDQAISLDMTGYTALEQLCILNFEHLERLILPGGLTTLEIMRCNRLVLEADACTRLQTLRFESLIEGWRWPDLRNQAPMHDICRLALPDLKFLSYTPLRSHAVVDCLGCTCLQELHMFTDDRPLPMSVPQSVRKLTLVVNGTWASFSVRLPHVREICIYTRPVSPESTIGSLWVTDCQDLVTLDLKIGGKDGAVVKLVKQVVVAGCRNLQNVTVCGNGIQAMEFSGVNRLVRLRQQHCREMVVTGQPQCLISEYC